MTSDPPEKYRPKLVDRSKDLGRLEVTLEYSLLYRLDRHLSLTPNSNRDDIVRSAIEAYLVLVEPPLTAPEVDEAEEARREKIVERLIRKR